MKLGFVTTLVHGMAPLVKGGPPQVDDQRYF